MEVETISMNYLNFKHVKQFSSVYKYISLNYIYETYFKMIILIINIFFK